MTIKSGYIGWANGLSLAWGAQRIHGFHAFVSIAWKRYVIGLHCGRVIDL